MNITNEDEERPLAWTAVLADTPVISVEGNTVGTVHEVIGSETEDVFHGVVLRGDAVPYEVLVPAAEVRTITNRRIDVGMTDEAIRVLPPYQEESSFHLGFVGHLRKRLGWVEEGREE